jgi:hypothetical protein
MRFLLLFAACAASQPKTTTTTAAAPVAAAPAPEDPTLFEFIPESAQAVILIRRSWILPDHGGLLDEDPAMRDELRTFLLDRVGTDVIGVDGVIAFATRLAPKPELGLLLHLQHPPTGALKGTPAGDYQGTPMISLAPDAVAALTPAGVVLGNPGAVKAAIAMSREQPTPGRGRGPLSSLRAADVRDMPFIAALDPTLIADPQTQMVVNNYGIKNLTLIYQRPDLIRLTIRGEPQKLENARQLLQQLIARGIQESEAQKNKLTAGTDALAGAGAIVGYHSTRRALETVTPKMVDGALVSEYRLPKYSGATMMAAVIGVGAAIAIPAFEKYQQRSKEAAAAAAAPPAGKPGKHKPRK